MIGNVWRYQFQSFSFIVTGGLKQLNIKVKFDTDLKKIFDVDTFFGTVLIILSKFRMQQVNPPNNLKIVAQELTLGKSLR